MLERFRELERELKIVHDQYEQLKEREDSPKRWTMRWLLTQSEKTVRELAGLPMSGLKDLLGRCKEAGFEQKLAGQP